MKVKSICIVGGGSSGWMTAALLATNLKGVEITVIEPRDVPTIGVGESTMGHINRFLNFIGLSGRDRDFMSSCSATYKVSVRFNNFKELGHTFQYPFGKSLYQSSRPDDWFAIKQVHPDFDVTYSEFYNSITHLANTNKMCHQSMYLPNYAFDKDTAYHFDATAFGQYLKEKICIPNGVKVIRDTIEEFFFDNEGNLDFMLPKSSKTWRIKADLYIDCTGFKSMLLEQQMGSEFVSFKDVLLNDTALAGRVPYEDKENEILNTTDCTALRNGWVWKTPTWDRIGTGYVYSSDFASDEDAEREFRAHLTEQYGKERAEAVDLRRIPIRHGKHKQAWVKNVVGIGLSYGFLEPLEATGLFTTHENAIRLMDALQRRDGYVNEMDRSAFNIAADYDIESMKDFIVMHYTMSKREDSPYWKYITNNLKPISQEELTDRIVKSPRLYKEVCYNVGHSNNYPDLQGTLYIAGGMDFTPISRSQALYAYKEEFERWEQETMPIAKKEKRKALKFLETQPTAYQFLKNNIYVEPIQEEREED